MSQPKEPETYVNLTPLYRAVIKEDRYDKANRAIEQAAKVLTRDQVIECLFEIGYGDHVDFALTTGKNPFAVLTPLQLCATAAALVAYAESGGKQELAPRGEQE